MESSVSPVRAGTSSSRPKPTKPKPTGKRHVFDSELIRARIEGNPVCVWLSFPVGFAQQDDDNIYFHGIVEHVDTYMVKFCVLIPEKEPQVTWVAKNSMCGVHILGSEPTKEALAVMAA